MATYGTRLSSPLSLSPVSPKHRLLLANTARAAQIQNWINHDGALSASISTTSCGTACCTAHTCFGLKTVYERSYRHMVQHVSFHFVCDGFSRWLLYLEFCLLLLFASSLFCFADEMTSFHVENLIYMEVLTVFCCATSLLI